MVNIKLGNNSTNPRECGSNNVETKRKTTIKSIGFQQLKIIYLVGISIKIKIASCSVACVFTFQIHVLVWISPYKKNNNISPKWHIGQNITI